MYWFNSWSSCSNLVSRLSVILELPFIIKLEIPLTLSCIKFLISWMPGFLFSDFLPHLGGEHPLAVFWGRVHGRHYFWDLVCVRWFSIISSHFLNSLAEYKIIEWRSSLPWLSGFLTHFSIVSALQCSYWEVWCYSFFFFKLFTQGNVFDSFIYLFMAVLDLRFCARAFSSCGKRGPLFITVCGPLTIVVSLVAEHRLQTHRLSNCGSRAHLLCGMWDLPRPGLEPVFPALAGRFSTTVPPGKPSDAILVPDFLSVSWWAMFSILCSGTWGPFQSGNSCPGLLLQ